MGWGGANYAKSLGPSAIIDLTTAPTATAALSWFRTSAADDSVTLNNDSKTAGSGAFGTPTSPSYAGLVADDSALFFKVDTAGTYAGLIYNGTDTVSFSFSTAGIPTSLSVTPATQSVLVGAQADLAVTLLDAAGKPTQPQTVDSVGLTRSPTDDTIVAYNGTASAAAITSLDNVALSTGTAPFSLNTNPTTAGSTVVTATPAGTLASTGVTSQSATVVKTGTVSSLGVANMTVTSPSTAFNAGARPNFTAKVQNPTTTITVTVDDTTVAAAGNNLRFSAYGPAGTVINGVAATSAAPVFTDVTTDASKKATLTYTIAGNALLAGQAITIAQVNVRDDAATPAVNLVVTQTAALVQPSNIKVAPTVALAKVGASTPVTLQVDDSFGVPQSGWIVRAYRGTSATAPGSVTTQTLVGTTTTNAAGAASLTLTPLSTTGNNGVEYYFYTATAPVGGASAVIASSTTTINYTTSGNISAMSVVPSGTSTSTFNNTTSTITTAPVILVPDDTAGVPHGISAGAVTLATGVDSTAPTGNLATFTVTTTPANDVVATVTAASGLYLSATPLTATTAWSSGKQTVSIGGAGSTPLYVWGTKTGTHDIVFTSGGITLTGKIKVSNRAQDAYNISITPDKANVAKGGFTTLKAKVTDFWGNPVATTTGAITGTAAGEVLLGGNTNAATFTTNAAGEASITVIAANTVGAGTVTLTPTAGTLAPPAWAAGYTKPASFTTAPSLTAISLITVGEAPATKSITITGSRTTVSGKPGIKVDGVTVGIEDGKTVIPYFRFPGETSYAQGSARPVVTANEFTWQRKTGKKFYAYVTSDDGAVQSNRVIIPAN